MTEQETRYYRNNRRNSNFSSSNYPKQFLMGTENNKTTFNLKQRLIGIGIIVIIVTVVATIAALLPKEDRDLSHTKGNFSLSGLNVQECRADNSILNLLLCTITNIKISFCVLCILNVYLLEFKCLISKIFLQ